MNQDQQERVYQLLLRREERRESALDKLYMRVMQDKACEEQQRDQDRLNALEAALSEEE